MTRTVTIYRVEYRGYQGDWTDDHEHRGYSYHNTMRQAEDEVLAATGRKGGCAIATMEACELRLTKKAVLRLLNQWAAHSDNGP